MTFRKTRWKLPEIDDDGEILERRQHREPEGPTAVPTNGAGAPPTRLYYYGEYGRRWAGKGRKYPHRSWKERRKNQWGDHEE